MNTFSSILKYSEGKPPGQAQKRARSDFPKQVIRSRLKLRDPAKPIPDAGKRFVLGVASYSADELSMLDQLDRVLQDRTDEVIEVFDVLNCEQMSDFEKFIPGIESVYRTPVLGVIVNGKLIARATGLQDVLGTLQLFNLLDQSS